LCWTINLYILLITENTTRIYHLIITLEFHTVKITSFDTDVMENVPASVKDKFRMSNKTK